MVRTGHERAKGFSLLEMAVVLLIMGILATVIGQTPEPARLAGAPTLLSQAESALMRFVELNKRWPCVDSNGDGYEDCGVTPQRGTLPWATLGQDQRDFDAQSLEVGYSVHQTLTQELPNPDGDLRQQMLIRLSQIAAHPDSHQPYLARDGQFGQLSDCSFNSQTKNLAHALRAVPRPHGAEPACLQPVDGDMNALRFKQPERLHACFKSEGMTMC